jgi:hypothetical protein
MGRKSRKPTASSETPSTPVATQLPERWSAQRKADLVRRLLREEALDPVSRRARCRRIELERWKRVVREAGERHSSGPDHERSNQDLFSGKTQNRRPRKLKTSPMSEAMDFESQAEFPRV